MLTIRDVAKLYNGRLIFSGLSGQVEKGQILLITGDNGSGKSTLLRILCGLILPSSGEVLWHLNGTPMSPVEAMHGLGYVSPDMGLHDRLTASEHLCFFADLRRISHDAAWVTARLRDVQLGDYADYEVRTFSSGMRQRLKLACALVHDPLALVLDEPSSNMDQRGIELLHQIITKQLTRGIVVIATNEEREVVKYGQTSIVMGKSGGSSQERSC